MSIEKVNTFIVLGDPTEKESKSSLKILKDICESISKFSYFGVYIEREDFKTMLSDIIKTTIIDESCKNKTIASLNAVTLEEFKNKVCEYFNIFISNGRIVVIDMLKAIISEKFTTISNDDPLFKAIILKIDILVEIISPAVIKYNNIDPETLL